MNWTGGGLQRSKATGALTSHQKQRFGKVQTKPRVGGQKNSPLNWSILGNSVKNYRQQCETIERPVRLEQPQQTERTREKSIEQESTPLQSQSSNSPKIHSRHTYAIKKEPDTVFDDDLYNATPEPQKHRRNIAVQSKEDTEQHRSEESVSRKRRRLLMMEDWVGMTRNQHLHNLYVPPVQDNRIGRRRNVRDGHKARYISKQLNIISPFVPRTRRISPHSPEEQGHRHGKSDVRISIGGRVIPTGISSSSAPSRRRGDSNLPQLPHPQSASSDMMLLDHEESFSTGLCGSHHRGDSTEMYITKGRKHQEKSRSYKIPGATDILDLVRMQDQKASTEHKFVQQQHSPTTTSPRRHQSTDAYSNYIPMSRASIKQDERPLFASSSVSIHHPRPQSSRVSVLVHSSSSGNDESTFAHIGKTNPPISSSQEQYNDIWKTWMGALIKEGDGTNIQDQEDDTQVVSVSPGISTALVRPRSRMSSDNSVRYSRRMARSGSTNSMFSQEKVYQKPSSSSIRSSRSVHKEGAQFDEEIGYGPIDTGNIYATMGNHPQPSEQLIATRLDVALPEKTKRPDADEIWRKFVFDSSSDEMKAISEHEGLVISPVRMKEKNAPDMSVMGNVSQETSPGSRFNDTIFRAKPIATSNPSGIRKFSYEDERGARLPSLDNESRHKELSAHDGYLSHYTSTHTSDDSFQPSTADSSAAVVGSQL